MSSVSSEVATTVTAVEEGKEMKRLGRRMKQLGIGLGAIVLMAAGLTSRSGADASYYYDVSASASPTFVSIDRDGYILSPILEANLLEAKASGNSTGTRQGFASLANPGPIGGFPSLIGLAVSGLPPIPYPGYPLSVTADYPSVPEKHVGVGGSPVYDADRLDEGAYGAGVVFAQARADEDRASGDGVGGELSFGGGAVRVGAMRSSAKMLDENGTATATSRTHLSNVDILGLIQIPSIEAVTEVAATADGTKTTSTVTVSEVKALGADAVIDDQGIRITGLPGVPDLPQASVDKLNKELSKRLSQQGLTVRLLRGGEKDAPGDSATAATAVGTALEVSYSLLIPDGVPIPNIPGFPLGVPAGGGIPTVVTVSLARTSGTGVSGALGDLSGSSLGTSDADLGAATGAAGSGVADVGSSADIGGVGSSGLPVSPAASSSNRRSAGRSTTGSGPQGAQLAFAQRPTGSLEPSFRWMSGLALAVAIAVALRTRRRLEVVRTLPWRELIRSTRRRT
jgi:hypothetical protein